MLHSKKLFTMVVVVIMIFCCMSLVACEAFNSNTSATESTTVTSTDPPGPKERVVNTYINYTFDDMEIGDDLERAGYFESFEGPFVASSKDEDGNVWISTNGLGWGLAATEVYNSANIKLQLKDFCVQFDTRLAFAMDAAGAADGGICILRGGAGKYDVAMHYDYSDFGAGEGVKYNEDVANTGNGINLWYSSDVSKPFASTHTNSAWGESGSLIDAFSMTEGVTYTVTVMGKHQGIDEYGDEFFTLYVFVDDQLVIYQRDIVFWAGGFGIRGIGSRYEYGNFIVSDFPNVCPDGIDHYTVDTPTTAYSKVELTRLAAPEPSIDGTALSWTAVEGAYAYDILLDGVRVGHTTQTAFDFSDIYGEGTFKVMALSGKIGTNHSDQSEISFSHPASVLTKPVLLYEDNAIKWAISEGAEEYEIYVNEELLTTQKANVFYPQMDRPGSYVITVKAISASDAYLDSELSDGYTYTVEGQKLPAPVLTLNDRTVSWAAVEGADSYLVYVNDEEPVAVTLLSFTVEGDSPCYVTVAAVDSTEAKEMSDRSERVYLAEVVKLSAPAVSFINGKLSWAEVQGATKYEVLKNGAFLTEVNNTEFTPEAKGVYTVRAIGDGAFLLDSESSKDFVYYEVSQVSMQNGIASQEVGQTADFGWNIYNANYIIKEIDGNGIVWMGRSLPNDGAFKETWFWAKDGNDRYLENWSWTTYVKMTNDSADDAVQLMFGTNAEGGRYSCFFYFLDGGSMQIYHNAMVANSWEAEHGGTGNLGGGKAVELIKGSEYKITINHAKCADGSARMTVFVNDICVIDKSGLVLATGDFGLWLNAGVDAWFGSPSVTTLGLPSDCTFVGAPILLSAPAVTLNEGALSWSEIDYAYGYKVFLNGSYIKTLGAAETSFVPELDGTYTVSAIGNGSSVLDGAISQETVITSEE